MQSHPAGMVGDFVPDCVQQGPDRTCGARVGSRSTRPAGATANSANARAITAFGRDRRPAVRAAASIEAAPTSVAWMAVRWSPGWIPVPVSRPQWCPLVLWRGGCIAVVCLVGHGRRGPVSHGAGDDGCGLGGGGAKRRIVEMGVDGGGGSLAVPEQLAHGGQADAVHDALRDVGMARVVNADAAQPGLLADSDPRGRRAAPK